MIFHILIDSREGHTNHNVLVMDNILKKGLQAFFNEKHLSSSDINTIAQRIRNKQSCTDVNLTVLSYDDEDIAIPSNSNVLFVLINNKPHKFFGSYANFVLRLFAQDICAKDIYQVENLYGNAQNKSWYRTNIETTYGTQMLLTSIYINRLIFE